MFSFFFALGSLSAASRGGAAALLGHAHGVQVRAWKRWWRRCVCRKEMNSGREEEEEEITSPTPRIYGKLGQILAVDPQR